MNFRKLYRDTCIKYDVRTHKDLVFFPMVWAGKVIGWKMRDFSVSKKSRYHMMISGSYSKHLWGWNAVHTKDTIAITLGEFDAMAVQQTAGLSALSATNGDASLIGNIKADLKLLDQFGKIIFVPDKDSANPKPNVKPPSVVVQQASEILGKERCYIASPSLDDPNDYLLKDKSSLLKQLIWSARPASSSFFAESFRDYMLPSAVGIMTGWGEMDVMLKGLRMGEVTYLLGEPMSGKTTLVQWWMWMCSKTKVKQAAFVLEGSKTQFTRGLASTFYGGNIGFASEEALDNLADEMDESIYLSELDGRSSPEQIALAIKCAVLQLDVQIVWVDNITAISDPKASTQSTTEYVKMFDTLSTDLMIHIVVVSHIGRDSYGERPTMRSAASSSSVEKHAVNMIAVVREKGHREVGVLKCREYGDSADKWWKQPFDSASHRYLTGEVVKEFV